MPARRPRRCRARDARARDPIVGLAGLAAGRRGRPSRRPRTPARPCAESCSAMSCSVLVLPVPVAPAIEPVPVAHARGELHDRVGDDGAVEHPLPERDRLALGRVRLRDPRAELRRIRRGHGRRLPGCETLGHGADCRRRCCPGPSRRDRVEQLGQAHVVHRRRAHAARLRPGTRGRHASAGRRLLARAQRPAATCAHDVRVRRTRTARRDHRRSRRVELRRLRRSHDQGDPRRGAGLDHLPRRRAGRRDRGGGRGARRSRARARGRRPEVSSRCSRTDTSCACSARGGSVSRRRPARGSGSTPPPSAAWVTNASNACLPRLELLSDHLVRPDDPALGPTTITIGCANFEAVPRDKATTLAEDRRRRRRRRARVGATSWSSRSSRLNTWGACTDCADAHAPCAWHRGQAEPADGPACADVVAMAAAHGVHVIYGFEEPGDDRRHLQLGERRRARRARRHLPEAPPRDPARDRPVHARRRASGVRRPTSVRSASRSVTTSTRDPS